MTTPLVTLTTDFGTLDPYVAQMKGVLVSLVPDVRIHDLSHAIPAGDVRAGALFVEAAVPRFPRQAVHVVVVDPGVGGRRRPLALETSIGTLVGPDNGLFSAFLGRPEARAFVLDRREHWAANVSHTFHGRDVFAPVAARLAAGLPIEEVGSPVADPVRLHQPRALPVHDGIDGEVIHVDHFGNLVTNIPAAMLPENHGTPSIVEVDWLGNRIRGPYPSYDSVPEGAPLIVIGSTGRVEISVNRGRADSILGGGVGSRVRLRRVPSPDRDHGT